MYSLVVKNIQPGVVTLTLCYTRGLGIVVLYVMVSQPYGFSLGFFT